MTHLSFNRRDTSKPSCIILIVWTPAIKCTVEENQGNGEYPFLDTLVKPKADDTLSFTVYRKPTHTDQYLQWDSHHNLAAKYSVINTLTHRARMVCTKPKFLNNEMQHLRKALIKCKYLKWTLDKVERKFINRSQEDSNDTNNQWEPNEEDSDNPISNTTGRYSTKEKYNVGHIVIPYTQGLGESAKKICRKYGTQTHFRGNRTIKNILVKPKDKDLLHRKCGAIYWYQCGDLRCDE